MLRIVKGDVFEFEIMLCRVDLNLIENVIFFSKDLGLELKAEQEEDTYRIRILGERTKAFKAGFARFDVVVVLIDGERLTVKHNEKIEVLKGASSEVRNG